MISFKNIDLLKANKVAGVELFIAESGLVFNVSVLEKKSGKIHLISSFDNLDLEQFKQKVDKNIPLFISADGKGVLHKSVNFTEEEPTSTLLGKVLPGADENSFYVQGTAGAFISVVRREVLDLAFNELKSLGYYFIGAALGPFAIDKVATLIEEKTVNTSVYALKISEGKIASFAKKEAGSVLKVSIGGEQISEVAVLSFASALTYFLGEESFFNSDFLSSAKSEFKEKRKFTVLGIGVLVFFFVLMLVNFLVYDSLKSSNAELQAEFNLQSENFKKSEKLKKELEAKKELKDKLGVSGVTKIAYYLDQIAATVPTQIQLTEMTVNPVKKKIKDDKEIEYDVNHIVIAGKCKKSIYYNEWKQQLAKMDWVSNISVVNYIDADDEVGEFVLKLSY
ncbi:MAG: hypothetical protein NT150_01705 [Bacteroidetes bacterium]|nr:hypothetical protein [Bacteroidota bacterium]